MSTDDAHTTGAPTDLEANRPRLVVGDDGSPAADVVWLWVNNHRWPGWRISVVTARHPELGPQVDPEQAALHPWDPPHPRRLLTDTEADVEHLFAETDPRLALDSCSDAALVAVGPRGRGVMKQLHIGSTTEWLIGAHRPLSPVVVVRSARTTKDVLLCMDGSDHARAALETLVTMPWLSACRVLVLGVNDSRSRTEAPVTRAAHVLREHGVGQVDEEVVEAPSHIGELDVRSTVLAFVTEQKPDLVVVGARGTGGIRGLLVGSVTAAVVRHAPCSVLVARAG